MRLIDADELKPTKGMFIYQTEDADVIATEAYRWELIEREAPTVDAEPVVRCKDCRFFHKYGFKLEYTECTHFDCDVTENGYCWWGERK